MWYVGSTALFALMMIAFVIISFLVDDANIEFIEHLMALIAFGNFWGLIPSRCCAPCCCGGDMKNVPHPCPVGDCSTQNPKCVDYPMFVLYSAAGWVTFVEVWMMFIMAAGDVGALRLLRLIRLVWFILALVSVVFGYMKWKMLKQGNFGVLDESTAPKVIGTPIAVNTGAEKA